MNTNIILPSSATLQNGYILNGVANFTQSTNPTVRIGGGALVVGDKLYRTDLRRDGTWDGVRWLSEEMEFYAQFNSNASASFNFSPRYWFFPEDLGLYISTIKVFIRIGTPFTQGWTLNVQLYSKIDSGTPALNVNNSITFSNPNHDISTNVGGTFASFTRTQNTAFLTAPTPSSNFSCAQLGLTRTTGDTLIQPAISFKYNFIL